LATLAGHSGYVSACASSPDGKRVLSGSLDSTGAQEWLVIGNPRWPRVQSTGMGLWVARYHKPDPEPPPALPPPWTAWNIFQWTDGGQLGIPHLTPGVGACDANLLAL